MAKKLISRETEWSRVSKELKAEQLKLASYDTTLIPLLGIIRSKMVLDYGGGPGVLAFALKKLGAEVKVYDISQEMRNLASQKIGVGNVYHSIDAISKNYFDIVIILKK